MGQANKECANPFCECFGERIGHNDDDPPCVINIILDILEYGDPEGAHVARALGPVDWERCPAGEYLCRRYETIGHRKDPTVLPIPQKVVLSPEAKTD